MWEYVIGPFFETLYKQSANSEALQLVCVRKTKIRFRFRYKYPNWTQTVQKFDISADGFPTETACNLQFKLKSDKNNFACIQRADKNRTKLILNRIRVFFKNQTKIKLLFHKTLSTA